MQEVVCVRSMKIVVENDRIKLTREQWNGKSAYISNYPGLLDEVRKYTWTYTSGEHPYLRSSALNVYLHKFVLQFLYGKEKLDDMIGKSNIIEHLDNNGLNCTYENLHVLSADLNKAKAFTIDKKSEALDTGELTIIPALVTDVYYSHEKKYFQLQVFFNKSIVFNKDTNHFIESFIFRYFDFEDLYIDWLYCFKCIEKEEFDFSKNHAVKSYARDVPFIELREDEQKATFIERDGKYYLNIRTDLEHGPIAFINHTAFQKIEDNND